jgi:CheY-like chemotaxis protein
METKQDLTILVVDDDPVGVNVLERTMHKEVCQVITADDGPPVRRLASSQEVYMVE